MSQQINLYDPALLRRRELLTVTNLAATVLVLLLAMGGWGAALRARLAELNGESLSVESLDKGLQDQMTAMAKQVAGIKPDPRLAAALDSARELLGLRNEVVATLKKGLGSESVSFAEYLRGLARQTPHGLWLTGFSIGADGTSMEIRGRMTDPALLPEYIRRLDGEKAFKGRAFAELRVSPGKTESASVPFHEFVLVPADAGRAQEGKP